MFKLKEFSVSGNVQLLVKCTCIQVSHLVSLTFSASSAQQVQDIHVPRHETARRMPPRRQLHLRTFAGGAGKVGVSLMVEVSLVFASSSPCESFIIPGNGERRPNLSVTLARNNVKNLVAVTS